MKEEIKMLDEGHGVIFERYEDMIKITFSSDNGKDFAVKSFCIVAIEEMKQMIQALELI